MASMACRTFSSLECTCSLEQASSKPSLWPLLQVAHISSSSKHSKKPHRRTLVACSARETLVSHSPTQQTAQDNLATDSQPDSLVSESPDTPCNGFPADIPSPLQNLPPPTLQRDDFSADFQGGLLPLQLRASQETTQVGFVADNLLLKEQEKEEEFMPGAKRDGFSADFLPFQLPTSQETTQVGFAADTQPDLLLKEQEEKEEEFMKGFPGAKGATMKPLSSDVLAQFPEGFLSKVINIERLDWVTLVPIGMLPKGDRLVLNHNNESVILFWFKEKIYCLENRSPVAPMFEEGFAKAVITEEGLITCPVTQSKFDIRTGAVIDWLPNNPFLRLLTPAFSDLTIYAVKASPDHIFINTFPLLVGGFYQLAEFTGNRISTDPNYEEPIILDDLEFGFTDENELTNGRFAMLGFLALLLIEMTTGNGILKGSGILDFLYDNFLQGFPILRY